MLVWPRCLQHFGVDGRDRDRGVLQVLLDELRGHHHFRKFIPISLRFCRKRKLRCQRTRHGQRQDARDQRSY